ncbi:MAG: tyrosine-protein phosphatase, partial [Pseudobdellovibrio sp.]
LGLDPKKIYNIPFQWKDIKDEEKACEQVVQALSILNQVEKSTQDKVFFHCTVGEDRTGLLAGLISQIISNESMQSSFADEMCAKGYADGNPNKPKSVSAAVLKSLNPIYYKVSKLIETKQITRDHIDPAVCGKVANIEFSGQVQSCSSLK